MQKNGSVNAGCPASRPLASDHIFHIKIKRILLTYLHFCVKVKFGPAWSQQPDTQHHALMQGGYFNAKGVC